MSRVNIATWLPSLFALIGTLAGTFGGILTGSRMAVPNMCFNRNNEYGENGKTEYYGIE